MANRLWRVPNNVEMTSYDDTYAGRFIAVDKIVTVDLVREGEQWIVVLNLVGIPQIRLVYDDQGEAETMIDRLHLLIENAGQRSR